MVIDNFYFVLRAILPSEDNPPWLVDSNAPEPSQHPLQRFKSVAWGNLQILNDPRLIDHAQLAPGPLLCIPTTDTEKSMPAQNRLPGISIYKVRHGAQRRCLHRLGRPVG